MSKRTLAIPVIAMLAVALAGPGCRDEASSQPPPEPAAATAEQVTQLTRAAETAFEDGHFAAAAALYDKLLALAAEVAPGDDEAPWPWVDWHEARVMASWLAGELAEASASAARAAAALPAFADHFAALDEAMVRYTEAAEPMGDPQAQLRVLAMAPAVQLWRSAQADLARQAPGEPFERWPVTVPPDQRLLTGVLWSDLARLPAMLAAWRQLDQGRWANSTEQVVVLLVLCQPRPAEGESRQGGTGLTLAGLTPQQRAAMGLAYPLGPDVLAIQPLPAPEYRLRPLGEWIAWMGAPANQVAWNPPPSRLVGTRCWHLLVGLLSDSRVVSYWLCSGSWMQTSAGLSVRPGPIPASPGPGVVFARPAAPGLVAAWNVTRTISPDAEAMQLASEPQARLLAEAGGKLAGQNLRVERAGSWWKVSADGAAGPGTPGLSVLAGWLAYHGWSWSESLPVPSAPTSEPDEDVDLVPEPPTEP